MQKIRTRSQVERVLDKLNYPPLDYELNRRGGKVEIEIFHDTGHLVLEPSGENKEVMSDELKKHLEDNINLYTTKGT